jgi:hypothetical protein
LSAACEVFANAEENPAECGSVHIASLDSGLYQVLVAKAGWLQVESIGCLSFLIWHDLFGKPVSTFPDHALGAGAEDAGQ